MNFTDFFDLSANSFMLSALAVGLAASINFGIIGTYVVTRRISYLAGAVSHCVLGGIGVALWLRYAFRADWIDPLYGALPAALIAAFLVARFGREPGRREETLIGATWAIGMAVGLIFLDLTPGYFNLNSYLFGDILLVGRKDLYLILLLDSLIIILVCCFYHQFLAICFDEEFARLRGLNVRFLNQLLLALIAVSVVLMIRVVGIVLVIAMLTLPAATAGFFARRLYMMMIWATLFAAGSIVGGLLLSFAANLSAGPAIILLAGLIYFLASFRRRV